MKPLIVANWKCNPQTFREAKRLFNLVKQGVKNIKKAEVVICPPFVYLSDLRFKIPDFRLSAQDCFWEQKGAFTGEISPAMLKDAECQYVIIGHSERRRYLGETDEMINKKLKAVLETRLTPILCIGENQEQRDRGETENILRKQIEEALNGISNFPGRPQADSPKGCFPISNFTIAYEPVWAIGTGKACDVEEAQKMGLVIRKIISQLYNQSLAKNLRLLYGGSVNSKNASGFIKGADFQGLLIGGASLDGKEFIKIIKNLTKD